VAYAIRSVGTRRSPELGNALIKRLESLRPKRRHIEPIWRRGYDYTYPIRAAGLSMSGDVLQGGEGRAEAYAEAKAPEIYDSTASDASRILGSALMSGLTPANSRWFELDLAGRDAEDDTAKRWLDVAAEELWELIHESNYDSVGFECMIDAAIAGQFAMFIDEDPDGGFRFEQWPLAQCFFAASKPAGAVDTIFREFSYSLEQVVDEYGVESLDADNRKLWDERGDNPGNADLNIEILWAIYPRALAKHGSNFGFDLPFASCHVVKKSAHMLREGGFHEFPVVAPRWMLVPGSVYATGAVYEALADIVTLNEVIKLDLLNLDIAIAGMWAVRDDGVLNARSITLGPRKIIVVQDVEKSIKALTPGGKPEAALIKVEILQRSIRRVMMADQLEAQDKPNMTAYEVHVRVELVRQLLGPIYGRMQAEYLAPLVIRCFGIAYRAGALGPAPKSVGALPRVRYISPIARAQKLVDVAAMDRYETTLAQEEKVRPGVADNYDWDEGARYRAELLGVPMKLIPDKDDIASVREERAKAAAKAQAAEAMAKSGGGAGLGMMGSGLDAPIAPGVGLGADANLLAA
jgi:hypothetical protein